MVVDPTLEYPIRELSLWQNDELYYCTSEKLGGPWPDPIDFRTKSWVRSLIKGRSNRFLRAVFGYENSPLLKEIKGTVEDICAI